VAKKRVELEFKARGAEKVASQTKKIDQNLKGVGIAALKAGAAFFGAKKLLEGFKASIELAGQQELAERKLATALGGTSQELLDYASALQKTTTFGDEATIEAMSMMAAFTQDEEALRRLTEVTLDYAAATGTDLNAAAQLVGRTFGTSMNAMSRYGVAVEGAAGSSERLDSLTTNLATMFQGQAAAAADTMSGSIQQMQNAVGDTGEAIGNLFAPMVVSAAEGLQLAAEFAGDFVTGLRDIMTVAADFEGPEFKRVEDQLEMMNVQLETFEGLSQMAGDHFSMMAETLRNEIAELTKDLDLMREAPMLPLLKPDDYEPLEMWEDAKETMIDLRLETFETWATFDKWLEDSPPKTQFLVQQMSALGQAMSHAAIHGQDMGEAVVSSLKSIAVQMASEAALFAMLQMFFPGFSTLSGLEATKEGLTSFLLRGFTGQTPKVNNHIHISGGLISDSYVRNTLMPAMSRVRSFG